MIVDYEQIVIDELIDYAKFDPILPNYFTINEIVDGNNETNQSIRPSYIQSNVYPCIEVEIGDNSNGGRNMARDEVLTNIMYNLRCVIGEFASFTDTNGNIMSARKSLQYIADFVENTIATNYKFVKSGRTPIAKLDNKLYVFLRYTATHNKKQNKIY